MVVCSNISFMVVVDIRASSNISFVVDVECMNCGGSRTSEGTSSV